MYKIGDKVETPLGIGKLVDVSQNNETKYKVAYGTRTTWYVHDEIKPYRTAHEKLIELGWICKEIDGGKKYIAPNLEHGTFIVWDDKTFTTSDCDLDLSRILTQYLEELEGE